MLLLDYYTLCIFCAPDRTCQQSGWAMRIPAPCSLVGHGHASGLWCTEMKLVRDIGQCLKRKDRKKTQSCFVLCEYMPCKMMLISTSRWNRSRHLPVIVLCDGKVMFTLRLITAIQRNGATLKLIFIHFILFSQPKVLLRIRAQVGTQCQMLLRYWYCFNENLGRKPKPLQLNNLSLWNHCEK